MDHLFFVTESLTLLDNLVRGFFVCMILSNGICRCTVLPIKIWAGTALAFTYSLDYSVHTHVCPQKKTASL